MGSLALFFFFLIEREKKKRDVVLGFPSDVVWNYWYDVGVLAYLRELEV